MQNAETAGDEIPVSACNSRTPLIEGSDSPNQDRRQLVDSLKMLEEKPSSLDEGVEMRHFAVHVVKGSTTESRLMSEKPQNENPDSDKASEPEILTSTEAGMFDQQQFHCENEAHRSASVRVNVDVSQDGDAICMDDGAPAKRLTKERLVKLAKDAELTNPPPPRSNTCENCGQELNTAASKPSKVEELEKSPSEYSMASFCRICHCDSNPESGPLIAPCRCKGSLEFVHQSCLQQWIKSSDYKHCELCGFHFAMNSKLKPITKWEKLSMSTSERRKIICSVMFHVIAITCVVWSLYVLIERTAAEFKDGKLQWPFWTKLIVVAIGFTGGMVFMYVQCKVYVQLWKRLKAFNRIIYVQDQPMIAPVLQEGALSQTTSGSDERLPSTSNQQQQQEDQRTPSSRDEVVVVDVCAQADEGSRV